jgi:hypothetical protein
MTQRLHKESESVIILNLVNLWVLVSLWHNKFEPLIRISYKDTHFGLFEAVFYGKALILRWGVNTLCVFSTSAVAGLVMVPERGRLSMEAPTRIL